MVDPFSVLDADERELLEEAALPKQVNPMLATLVDEPFDREGWIFERKLDGERCIAHLQEGEVRLRSRNHEDLGGTYPELVDALTGALGDAVLDGEVVAFSGGVTSFERLQPRMQIDDPEEARKSPVAVRYYVFDLLHLDGRDLTGLRLRTRKRLLRAALDFDDPIRFTPHRNTEGRAFHADACERGWEGIIAKDGDSEYVQSRSRSWLKFKCVNRQELVIGGFTDPEGERTGFGALLVGFHRDGDLVYAGKVGTGYDDETLRDLGDRLRRLERATSPFAVGDPSASGVHFVTPQLVAEVGFTEWTAGDKLRHPRYLGLRRDKDAGDVVKEEPRG